MDRASAALDAAFDGAPTALDVLELRVLEGPQSGARAALVAGRGCVIATAAAGDSGEADILLRDEVAPPAGVRVRVELTQALVEVLHGEIVLGEQTLAAGAQAVWPRHAPLRIGSSVVAFGLACEDDWTASPDAPAGVDPAAPAADAALGPLRRRAEMWMAATGTALLVACGGTLWMAHVAAAPQPVNAPQPVPLAAALKASEFAGLELVRGADGRVTLRGRLATMAQRLRLERWLAARAAMPADVALDVLVDEAVLREVTEVFRINGVAVQARSAGPGVVVAEAEEHDAGRLARAEDVVRRDVRGFDRLTVRNSAAPLPPPAPPVADEPGKRIASLVPIEPAHVVTADGSRYFVGSMLPSGYRIASVAEHRITLERDGRQTVLNF
jgi:type III secretion protein D